MLSRYFGGTIHIFIESTKISLIQHPAPWQRRLDERYIKKQIDFEGNNTSEAYWESSIHRLLDLLPLVGVRCQLIIDDQLLRYFMTTPASNTRSIRDCRDAAKARFQTLFEENSRDWKIQADWQQGMPFISCALPTRIASTIQKVLSQHKLKILSFQPLAIAIWNNSKIQHKENDWLLFFNQHHLLILTIKREKLFFLEKKLIPLEAKSNNQWLNNTIKQITLRNSEPMPNNIYFFGDMPSGWGSTITANVTKKTNTLFFFPY